MHFCSGKWIFFIFVNVKYGTLVSELMRWWSVYITLVHSSTTWICSSVQGSFFSGSRFKHALRVPSSWSYNWNSLEFLMALSWEAPLLRPQIETWLRRPSSSSQVGVEAFSPPSHLASPSDWPGLASAPSIEYSGGVRRVAEMLPWQRLTAHPAFLSWNY